MTKKAAPTPHKPASAIHGNGGAPHSSALSTKKIKAKYITGLKYFKTIRPLLKSLRKIGTERDRAGNRDLHMDEYCVLVLVWLFNPVNDIPSRSAAGQ